MAQEQLSLFDIEITQKHIDDGLECIKCSIVQPIENFKSIWVKGNKKGEIKRTCKSCTRGQRRLINQLKLENLYPDESYTCPICERDIGEVGRLGQPMMQRWVLDHCHQTETFRGWLCGNCNTGLGGLKDNIKRVSNALKYLKKHEESLKCK
tara:strand:+ start:28 stop:483 length:456 start_codon:yes stop_codon:yes gene_type:complete